MTFRPDDIQKIIFLAMFYSGLSYFTIFTVGHFTVSSVYDVFSHFITFYCLYGTNLKKNRGGALNESKCSLDVESFYHVVDSLQWLDKT